ncbi:MAG: hypothetical protein ACOX57_07590 [Limnochordia bacterium]|jgi:hypothetical protein|nr:hypothetical protein [Bacillota bacterium]
MTPLGGTRIDLGESHVLHREVFGFTYEVVVLSFLVFLFLSHLKNSKTSYGQ